MVDSWIALKRIQELENTLAECYEWLGNRFSDREEVRAFFYNLGLEEIGHGDLASYQARIVVANSALFPAVDVDLVSLESALTAIRKFRKGPTPSLEEALRFSHDLEESLAEQYSTSVVSQTNHEMAKLIEALSEECGRHHARLMDFASSCDVALP